MISPAKFSGMIKSGGAKIKGESDRTAKKSKAKTPDLVDDSPFLYSFRASLPPSANNFQRSTIRMTKAGKPYPARYTTGAASAWKETFQNLAKLAGIRQPRWGKICIVIYLMAEPDELDVDNGNKLLLDALKHIAYYDDKQVYQLMIVRMGKPAEDSSHLVVEVSRYEPWAFPIPQTSGVTHK